jgi:nucleotidyltransferase substrate binding protein (TIGR01987 family)
MSGEELVRLKQKLLNYEKALASLDAIIGKIRVKPKEDDDYVIYRDSAVKRYEYSLELARKLMAQYIEFVDRPVHGQKLVLRRAFEFDLVEDRVWFEMIEDRNVTAHEYSEELAEELLEKIYGYAEKLRAFYDRVAGEISKL